MPSYEFMTVDVFTDKRFGGNPLAVFPDAGGLTDEQMQAIAAEFNLSETTFILPPEDPRNHARVRIFTPRAEMPFAGHPNVGTGYVLARIAGDPPEHYTFEEIAGLVRVHILRDAAGAISGARISAPRALSLDIAVPVDLVAACAGVSEGEILTEVHYPIVASVGAPFVIAEVASLDVLARAHPVASAFRAGVEQIPALAEPLQSVFVYPAWRRFPAPAKSHVRPPDRHCGGSGDWQRRRRAGGVADVVGSGRECGSALRHRAGRGDGANQSPHCFAPARPERVRCWRPWPEVACRSCAGRWRCDGGFRSDRGEQRHRLWSEADCRRVD